MSLVTRSRWLTVTRGTYSFTNNPKTTVHANGRLLRTYMAASEGCPCKKKFGYLGDAAYPGEFEQKATVSCNNW